MIFSVKDGNFSYTHTKSILKEINFSVEHGEILSILGANGAGKTTLLKCMLGLQKWDSGETTIDGLNINKIRQKEFWSKVGYVPQARLNTFVYTVLEMTVLGRATRLGDWEQPKKEDYLIAEQCLETLGIHHLKDKLCNEISGGEYQLVLIARSLCSSPELLVLDEPETNLDYKNQLIVLNAITTLRQKKGISAIINTHFPEHALDISQKALLLFNNGSSLYGKTDEVMTENNLNKAFGMTVCIRDVMTQTGLHKVVVADSLTKKEYDI